MRGSTFLRMQGMLQTLEAFPAFFIWQSKCREIFQGNGWPLAVPFFLSFFLSLSLSLSFSLSLLNGATVCYDEGRVSAGMIGGRKPRHGAYVWKRPGEIPSGPLAGMRFTRRRTANISRVLRMTWGQPIIAITGKIRVFFAAGCLSLPGFRVSVIRASADPHPEKG